jgi:hypothetical protein
MLSGVDFIVESLRADSGELEESVRAGLLQLILSIANLDQHSRSKVRSSPKNRSGRRGINAERLVLGLLVRW